MTVIYNGNGLKPAFSTKHQSTTYTNWGYNLSDYEETTLHFRINYKPKTNRSSMYIRCYVDNDFSSTQFQFRHNRTYFYFSNTDGGANFSGNTYLYVNSFYASKASSIVHHTCDLTLHNYARDGKLWPVIHVRTDYIYSNQDDTNKIAITEFNSGELYSSDSSHAVERIQFFLNNSATFEEFDLQAWQDGGLADG
jgi:hypothetical protein